jgi:hypothetical protein
MEAEVVKAREKKKSAKKTRFRKVLIKRDKPMISSSKSLKQLIVIILVLLLAISVMGTIEIIPPVETAETIEQLDESSRKQLDYFLEIAGIVETINQNNFFKPYDKELKEKISQLLIKAAEIEADECHKKYLLALSYEVLSDRFYSLVPEWFLLEENKTEIVFLHDETHMRQEFWLKLFFHSFFSFRTAQASAAAPASTVPHKIFDTVIFVNDSEETQRVEEYIQRFDKLDSHVPYLAREKVVPYTADIPPIKVAHLVYSSLPGRVSIVYPDREVFYHQGRYKIVIFKNLIDAYVKCILKPLSEKILSDHHLKSVEINSASYLSNLVMYKLSHHMGPMFLLQPGHKKRDEMDRDKTGGITGMKGGDMDRERFESREIWSQKQKEDQEGKKEEMELKLISETLGDSFWIIEEIKASVIAVHNTSVLIEESLIPRENEMNIYATYLVSLVDKLRKDPTNPLRAAYALQLNYLLRRGAVSFNINTKKLSIDLSLFPGTMETLAGHVIRNYQSPYQLLRGGGLSQELQAILENLKEIPTDVNIDINVKTGWQANVKEK